MGSIEGREGEIEPGWREVTSRKPNITHGDTHHLRRYEDIIELMCDPDNPTPMVRLHHTPFKKAKIYAKLEWYNPFGSIKDRPALNMVRQAQEKGTDLQHMAEATSGNTGLALAMVANHENIGMTIPISVKNPVEKRNGLKLVGANVVELPNVKPPPGQREGAMVAAAEFGSTLLLFKLSTFCKFLSDFFKRHCIETFSHSFFIFV